MSDDLIMELKDVNRLLGGTPDQSLMLMLINRIDKLNRKMDDLIKIQARRS